MGKGDRKTAKGKRFIKSFGKSRPKTTNKSGDAKGSQKSN